ncbi:MAG: porin, partial [Candidatus Omnitrophica bacterium]|nr:porin [Candidatus Omnitrophota bacterium]
HTGIRSYVKPVAEWPLEGYIGFMNGWDVARDNNRAKTMESQIVILPFDNLSLAAGSLIGAERTDTNKNLRSLIDFVFTYQPIEKLTLKANYNYGWEENAASALTGYAEGKDAAWDGIAVYGRYQLRDWWALACRGEYFHDRNGIRTGYVMGLTPYLPDVDLWEFTFTSEFNIWKDFITRLEYRYDQSNGDVFLEDKIMTDHQSTVSLEVIYRF